MKRVVLSSMLLVLGSCGYHFEGPSSMATVSIPAIKGDRQGALVTELVHSLTAASLIDYVDEGGMFSLEVKILTDGDERIGFRFDRDPVSGKRRDNIVGVENRRALAIEIQLVDPHAQKVVFGPQVIRQTVDSDYVDSNSIRDLTFITTQGKPETVLNFSLGQLDSVEGAHDDTTDALYRRLAEKVADELAQFLTPVSYQSPK